MFRYAHTNMIARDHKKLIAFYKEVFHCRSIGETRDLRGEWLDRLTGLSGAHIVGEHLCLPGYGEDHPTLEIFSYDHMEESDTKINRCGLAHLAFEVDDVEETLKRVLENGGGQIGELVTAEYPGGKRAVFVYASDCEGNILELQSWS
ncbi:VOC family protein [Clostridium sp. AF18-27]|uniref:VOC family protein n=1 Tax=Enterocloster lavalensis TaxID=460384 RepID=UPI000E49253C|nr:VOC family protein [Enterocloster lavalensis]RHR53431.1 VOC family protein [Clostridium sp. AF18-27]